MTKPSDPTTELEHPRRATAENDGPSEAGQRLVAMPAVDPDSPPPADAARPVEDVVAERVERSRQDSPNEDQRDDAHSPEASSTETQEPATSATAPQLAEGIDLVGEYKDSGYKEPRYIARREDGQIIQLSELLYSVADECTGDRNFEEIAQQVSERYGKTVSSENVKQLVEESLRPLGVLAQEDGSSPKVEKPDPLLALKFRTKVIPARFVRVLTILFKPLYWPPVLLAVLGALAAFDAWLFFVHGVAQPTRELIYQPALMIGLLAIMVVSVFFHEIGHATALAYGGGNPGVMGAGIYIVWPAFYTDVTDAYRLSKGGRLRTDLGGIYFNGIFALLMGGAYFITGFEPLLIVAVVQHFAILQQMLPLLRLDGYYVLADMTGVPDLFSRIRPTLRSLIPWRKTEPAVKELKPWVRVVVTLWVMTVVPLLLYVFTMMVISAPRLVATAWDSFFIQLDRVRAAFGGGETTKGVASSFQMVALALPATGMVYSFGRVSKRVAAGAWKQSKERPFLRVFYGALGVALIAGLAYLWLPNGEYKPIQPDERGTVTELTGAAREIREGRPGLTEEREEDLGGAPVLRDQQDPESSGPWDSPTRDAPVVDDADQPQPGTTPTPEETTEEDEEPTDEETVPAEEEEEEEPAPTPTPSG